MPDPDVTAERAKPPASETDGKATRDSPAVSDHAATRMRTAPPPQPPRRPTTPPAATSAGDLPAVDPAELPLFRWAFRLAFVILVLGLTAIAHPQPEPDAVPPDEGSFLHTILTYDFWFPIHLASITAYMLGLVLFLAYYRSMPEQPAKSIASVAAAFGVVSTAVVAIWVVVDMVSIVRLAELWEADPTAANLAAINAVEEVILALFSLSVILYTGLTFALFGLAMLHSRLYPDWVGIWGLLGGIFSMLAGTAQLVTSRDALVTDVVIPLAFFVTTVWFLVATVIMWRRVSAAAAPTAST